MTSHYVLTPAAQRDLDSIWDYTAEHWNPRQANDYIRQIHAALENLLEGRSRARAADEAGPAYSKYAVGSHVLFLRPHSTAAFEVVRILHQGMDVGSHVQ